MSEPLVPERKRRPNRFDRPKEPRDWRWVIGTIGRVLIAIGLLMFAFVSYQLWGTGIRTAQAQNRLESKFEDLLETATTVPIVTTTSPPTTTTSPSADTLPPSESTTTVITTTTLPPPVISAPEEGEPLARLEIPSIGLDWIMVSGVSPGALQDGPGHFPETPLPGQVGNSAIAGHRTTHGQPFFEIDQVQVGDDIVITTLAGRYVYVMTSQELVAPSDYAKVIPAADPTKATITLVSCHPRYSTRQRIIVVAELDPERSDPITAASPPGEQDASTLPDETPDTEPDTTGPEATDPASTDPGSTAPVDTESATTEPATGEPDEPATSEAPPSGAGVDAGDDAAGQELFENGWFSDPDAWPHVLGWGLLLSLIAIGSYLVSRRFKRNLIGLAIGIIPFVVVLYFWFENVNRLLPPNL